MGEILSVVEEKALKQGGTAFEGFVQLLKSAEDLKSFQAWMTSEVPHSSACLLRMRFEHIFPTMTL